MSTFFSLSPGKEVNSLHRKLPLSSRGRQKKYERGPEEILGLYNVSSPAERDNFIHPGGTRHLTMLATGGGKSLCFQLPALLREGLRVFRHWSSSATSP